MDNYTFHSCYQWVLTACSVAAKDLTHGPDYEKTKERKLAFTDGQL